MQTITILEKARTEQELVAISKKEYEALIRAQKPEKAPIVIKRSPSFRVAKKHEPFYDALDKELTEALREVAEGKVSGPFESVDELIRSLES